MSIQIRNISKQFGDFHVLRQVDLDIASGELVALLGPSGCGKTTLLRIIAGLETADQGTIAFSGEDTTHVHVRERHVGFVFQHYALFRHMTVFENVAFGLRVRPKHTRPTEAAIQKKVHDLLNLVQLDWLGDRYPSQLSGGQRQRIALARALAVEPRVLLLDEPFGALDAKVRKDLRRWLRRLHDDLDVTSIFVTHDQEEALEVADRVVLMNSGRVEQVGSPQQVWDNPANPFVYGFLGDVNLFKGRGAEGETHTYICPHDLDVRRYSTGDTGIVARLERALVVGSVARLELVPHDESATPDVIKAEIPANEFRDQHYVEGELLVLTPRKSQVFVSTHSLN